MPYTKETVDDWLRAEAEHRIRQDRWPDAAVVGFHGDAAGVFATTRAPTEDLKLEPVAELVNFVHFFRVDGLLVSMAAWMRKADDNGSVDGVERERALVVEAAFGPLGSKVRHEIRMLPYEIVRPEPGSDGDIEVVWRETVGTLPDSQPRSTWNHFLRRALREHRPKPDMSFAEMAEYLERLGHVVDLTPEVAERFDVPLHALPAGV